MPKSLLAALLFALAAAAGVAAPRPPHVLVVSDVLSDTPEKLRPQPGKPIHYIIIGNLENDLGTPRRSPGNRAPTPRWSNAKSSRFSLPKAS